MKRYIDFVEGIGTWTGKAFAWCILIMTLAITYEVFVSKVFRDPTEWAFDISYIMYGTLFMMAGAYTLSRDGHVRGDVAYRLWKPKTQAAVELVLYFLFFFPGILALMFAGLEYALESWGYTEKSIFSPLGVPIYPFKTVIPVAGALLFFQGTAEVLRCVICLRTGAWPPRRQDIEEMESILRQRREDDSRGARERAGPAEGPTP
jgi:TRAP-type mannitol/chloroaromatic compound transport system permease small subunit